jgi:hypothetical protein
VLLLPAALPVCVRHDGLELCSWRWEDALLKRHERFRLLIKYVHYGGQ